MPRYLVVANQTLGQPQLTETILGFLHASPSHFHLLVPATLTHARGPARLTRVEAAALAQSRLELALAELESLGVPVSGEVGDPSPMLAIGEALSRGSFDQLIISTLSVGPSQWLRRGLPGRVERVFDLPVTLVIPRPATAPAESSS